MGTIVGLAPVLWLAAGIILAVAEGVTVQLVAIWFALGALVSAVAAVLGLPFVGQLLIFVLVSALLLVCTRPFVKKKLQVKKQSTNADQVIGKIGIVQESIDNVAESGRVSVMGLSWSARSKDGTTIEAGSKVIVLAIEGVKLIVEPLRES